MGCWAGSIAARMVVIIRQVDLQGPNGGDGECMMSDDWGVVGEGTNAWKWGVRMAFHREVGSAVGW